MDLCLICHLDEKINYLIYSGNSGIAMDADERAGIMTEESAGVVRLKDNYYHDSFGKVIVVLGCLCLSIVFLGAISFYLFMNKPEPVTFRVAEEWRVQAPVPIQQPYLTNPEVLQWVSEVVPRMFNLDFISMDSQLADAKKYFTVNGYQIFLNQLKNYADAKMVQSNKMFVNAEPTSAPVILNQGVLSGRYSWWVQIPINISYAGAREKLDEGLTLQVLVVRTDTTNNLTGILIHNVIVEKDSGNLPTGTGSA